MNGSFKGVPCVGLRLLSDDEDWDSQSRRRNSTHDQGAAKQPFPGMACRHPRKSQNSFALSWADAVTVLSSVQENVMRPWPCHFACMSLTKVCFVPATWSRALAKTPRNFQADFLECQERTTYQNSLRRNLCIFAQISLRFSLFSSSINSLQNLTTEFWYHFWKISGGS